MLHVPSHHLLLYNYRKFYVRKHFCRQTASEIDYILFLRAKVHTKCNAYNPYISHIYPLKSSMAQYEPNTWMKKLSLTIRPPNPSLFACRRLVLEKTRHLGGVDMASQVVTHRHQSPHSQLPFQSSLFRHPHIQICQIVRYTH